MFLIDDGTPDLVRSLFELEIIHKSAVEEVPGYYRNINTLLLLFIHDIFFESN